MPFTVTPPGPSIISFSPTSGATSDVITITGTNFTGATSVRFNGVPASYTIDSATQITATVPNGSSSGLLEVVSPNGMAQSSTGFFNTSLGGGTLTVKDEGVVISTSVTSLNFVGAGVVASGTGNQIMVTVAGTGSASTTTTGAPSAAGITYTASQSSVWSPLTGTFPNLNDSDGSTGAGTHNFSTEFVKADYGIPVLVSAITLGGGSLAGWGPVAPYVNNKFVQYSNDNTNWTDVFTVSGVTDSGIDQFKKFTLSTPISAQYWRITGNGYLATTEFKLE